MRKRAAKYPFGTIVAYGPDNTLATTLAVGVFTKPGQKDPVELRRWSSTGGDVRNDRAISAEIAEFLKQHGVRQTVVADRIMGCPHEEGVDYPMGESCPRCPFWRTVDRFTHRPITSPALNLTPEEVLAELSVARATQPIVALAAADLHRKALMAPLLTAIEQGLANPAGLPEGATILFNYAMYLMAKWRERRAYPLVVRWLSLPGEGAFDIGGAVVTEEGGRFLASTYDSDIEPIKALILNREANEYCRGQAIEALAILVTWDELALEAVVGYFEWLAHEGLERAPSHAWNSLAVTCADIEARSVFAALRQAYTDGLIDPLSMGALELDEVEAAPRGKEFARFRERHAPITDVARATSWWACFSGARKSKPQRLAELAAREARVPLPGTSRKIGRNDLCPCGSGRKYKRCCGP